MLTNDEQLKAAQDDQIDHDVQIMLARMCWLITHINWLERAGVLVIVAITAVRVTQYQPQPVATPPPPMTLPAAAICPYRSTHRLTTRSGVTMLSIN